MKTEIENLTPVYELIPMSEIDIEARKIAVAWVEQYGTMGFDIQNKHKLASDIMNYHRQKVAQSVESKTDIVDEEQEDWEQKAKRLWQDRSTRLEAVKIVYDKRKPKMKLSEAKAYCEKNFAVPPVDEDELWDEVEKLFNKLTEGNYLMSNKPDFLNELKSKFSITRKQ